MQMEAEHGKNGPASAASAGRPQEEQQQRHNGEMPQPAGSLPAFKSWMEGAGVQFDPRLISFRWGAAGRGPLPGPGGGGGGGSASSGLTCNYQ